MAKGKDTQSANLIGHNLASLRRLEVATLRQRPSDPRRHLKADIERAKPFVHRYAGQALPIIVNSSGAILCGGVFVDAAREIGVTHLLVIEQEGLSEQEELLYSISVNKVLSTGSWDAAAMDRAVREFEREIEGFAADLLAFAPGELDKLLGCTSHDGADELPTGSAHCVSTIGSLYYLDQHRLICGSARDPAILGQLMDDCLAAAAISDPPFGCKIDGFVSKRGRHQNFFEAAGEMGKGELFDFFLETCLSLKATLAPGALIYLFIDWRSLALLQAAAEQVFGKIVNLCVWAKDRAGMGSFYRSRHELVLVLAMPGAPHRNNIELGRHGRDRSNVWEYPFAASSRTGREGDLLKHHPTPKSVEMIADAMLDCTRRGEIVVDSFLGSGTSLIAAERTGRLCYGADLDPQFVDLAVRRWQRWTGGKAIDAATGKTFDELEAGIFQGDDR